MTLTYVKILKFHIIYFENGDRYDDEWTTTCGLSIGTVIFDLG